jgi:hypothetical protein
LNQLTLLDVESLKKREEEIRPHVSVRPLKNVVGAERLNLPANRTSQRKIEK